MLTARPQYLRALRVCRRHGMYPSRTHRNVGSNIFYELFFFPLLFSEVCRLNYLVNEHVGVMHRSLNPGLT